MKQILFKILFAFIILFGSMRVATAQVSDLVISPAQDTFCVGQEISVTYTSLDIDYFDYWYELDSSDGGRYGFGQFPYLHPNSPANFYIPAVPPGRYSIILWDTDFVYGGPTGTSGYYTSIYIAPAAAAVITPAGSTTFCGGSSVTLNNTGSSGRYQWLLNGDTLNGDTDNYYVANQPGNYTLQVTNGCGTFTATAITVTVDSTPTATISPGGPTTFCQGDSVILSTITASAYQWSDNETTQSITVKQSGGYSVSVDNGGNCSAISSATVVTVNPAPSANITPDGSVAFCPGDSTVLTAGTESSYLWSNGATTQTITVNAAGSYAVKVTDTLGCTAASQSTVITINQPPTASITAAGSTNFCEGDSVLLGANSESGYAWNNGGTTQNITVNQNGNYTVTVTDANGCTGASAPTIVTVNSLPNATITASGSTTFCMGDSVTLTANAQRSYLWSPAGETGESITVKQTGSYTVQVTDANGCSATSPPIIVTVDTLPNVVITISGDTVFCAGGSVTLSSGNATIYAWSNGSTAQAIDVTQSGTYSVTLTNGNDCSASSSAIGITVNALPVITITPASVSFCPGGNATLTATGGTGFAWSSGANVSTALVNPDTTTTYTVTVTNEKGCSDTASRTVTVNPLPAASISPSGTVSVCQGDSVQLQAAFGASNYLWNTNATTQNIDVSLPGNYSVTVTSVNNCTAASGIVTVQTNPLPAAPAISRSNDTLTSTIANSYQWYLNGEAISGATERTLKITENGNYAVQITDSNGCQNTSAVLDVTALGIDDITNDYTVLLYPNPNNGNFTLRFSDAETRVVSMFDVTGRLILAQQVTQLKDFDCPALLSGVYHLEIKDENGVKAMSVVITK